MKNVIDISSLPRNQELWKYEDVMRKLRVCRSFIDKRIYRGEIRVVKMGKLNRFIPSDIEKFISKNTYSSRT
jgi:predicted DNA-binding transcriptional regulator AlpA